MSAAERNAALVYVACEEPNAPHLAPSTLEALVMDRMLALDEARDLRAWCAEVATDTAFPSEGSHLRDALESRSFRVQRRAALDVLRMRAEAVAEMAREEAMSPLDRFRAKHGADSVRQVAYGLPGGVATERSGGRLWLLIDSSMGPVDVQEAAAWGLTQ